MANGSPLVMGSISPEMALDILRSSMERIAGEHFNAHWPADMEFVVWNWAQDASRSPIPRCERVSLRGLAACAGGWLKREPGDREMGLIPLPQWLRAYGAWMGAGGNRSGELGAHGPAAARLVVPVSSDQARRLLRAKLHPLLDELLLDFWQAKLSGTPGGAELLGKAIRVIAGLHEGITSGRDLAQPDEGRPALEEAKGLDRAGGTNCSRKAGAQAMPLWD